MRVLDGDTLMVGGERVRLLDVDAPETGRRGADEATRFVTDFVSRGPVVLLPDPSSRDRYGRLLARVEVDGRDLSRALVEAGWAWIYDASDADLRSAQRRAVEARRGVHAALDRIPGAPWLVSRHRFHARGCPGLRGPSTACGDLPGLLARGRAPCRTCLAWPPDPPTSPW